LVHIWSLPAPECTIGFSRLVAVLARRMSLGGNAEVKTDLLQVEEKGAL
jgi:hypothetical protein